MVRPLHAYRIMDVKRGSAANRINHNQGDIDTMTQADKRRDSELLKLRAAQVQRGGARAAVLGVNDGLVSTVCIALGVAGATGDQRAVLIAGLAGLIAGAISMAAGEWISVRSQVELFQGVLADLKAMVNNDRELLVEQLQTSFEEGGLTTKTAGVASGEVAANDHHLFNQFSRNVMGLDPDELGSPWTAAVSSFALFTAGALVALAPWFFIGGTAAVLLSITFTAIGGLIVGAYIGHSSGNNKAKTASRQLLIIVFASLVTYGVGALFGTVV